MTIYHTHHIIPKHMGGSDDPSNLIKLTIEEHAEAHKVLYETYGCWQDELAWKGLSGQIGKEGILEEIYKNNAKNMLLKRKSIVPWNKGKTSVYTEETLNKMRVPKSENHKSKLIGRKQSEETKNKLRKPKTKDHKEKLRSANLGKKQTEETKKKNSENNKGKNNPRAILTEYTFIHPEFGEFVGDRFALSEKYNIKINYLLNLVNGKISHTSGWTLKP